MEFKYEIYNQTSSTTVDKTHLIQGGGEETHVAKETPELNLEILALNYEDKGERWFGLAEVPANTEDHDYSITSCDVQDIGNGITITWIANNVAPSYTIGITDENNNDIFADALEITNGEFTYHYNGAENVHIVYVLCTRVMLKARPNSVRMLSCS
jgi:hypothetical protein